MVRYLLWLMLAVSVTTGVRAAETVHVAADGDDNWSGRQARPGLGGEGPLRTLPAAQRAARIAMARQRGGVQVLIQPGVYRLDAPLRFGPPDSGRQGEPMVYRASQPGTVRLSGGAELTSKPADLRPREASFAVPPEVGAAFWASGPQLFINGRRAVLARQPNAGSHWFAGSPVAVVGEPAHALGHEAFQASTPALDFVQQLGAEDRARALVHVMQSWSSGRHRLAAGAPVDALRLRPRSRWPFLFFGTSQRYWVENVAAAFDAPGEWIGSANGIRYKLQADDTNRTTAVLPIQQQLVQVQGGGPDGPLVQYLELLDLGFEHTRADTPPAGWVDTQAAVDIGAAIEVDHARHVRISGCQVNGTGGYAIWLRRGVRNSEVSDCNMTDLGGGAVKIGDPGDPASDSAASTATGGNVVRNNRISQTGQHYPGAVAVWVGPSFDNVITQNSIDNTTYTAISVGWQWGYGGPSAGRNRIVANALNDIGRQALADLGGIYTLGEQPGTVIADNYIREVRGFAGHGAGAWGIYNDEGSSGIRVEGNVVLGTDSGGYHLHFGRDLLVQENLFALGDAGEVSVTRTDPARTQLALRNNLWLTRGASPLTGFARAPDAEFSGNLAASIPPGRALDLQACGSGCGASAASLALVGVPGRLQLQGVDGERAKRWQATAAAAGAQGTRAGPLTQTRRSGPEATAERVPALQMAMNLRDTPDRLRPPGWRHMPASPAEAIATLRDPSAPGGRCLQLEDSAAFAHRFEPYVFTLLNHMSGTSSASFALRVDDSTELVHEWRDNQQPFRIGPSLRISSRTGVQAAGKTLVPVAPGSWLRVRVRAALVPGATWDLEVTDASGKVHAASGLPPKTPGWQSLQWLGFIADAATPARACLAEVRVTNEPPRQ